MANIPDLVTPKVDIAFKKIFGVEENKDLLISLINSIVSEEDQAVSIEVMNPYNLQSFKNDKLSILDIKARRKDGLKYNIEIQVSDEGDYDKRALYYWSKAYTEQMERGMQYDVLRKTIGIHILNFFSVPNSDRYHNVFTVQEKETKLPYFMDFEMHTIELCKFEGEGAAAELDAVLKKVRQPLDEWVTFLTKHQLMDSKNLPKELRLPEISKAMQVLDVMNFDKEEREEYEARLKWLRIEASTIRKLAQEQYIIGKTEGLLEGEARGKAEGKAEMAKSMLSNGLGIELISSITGLSGDEISNLGMK